VSTDEDCDGFACSEALWAHVAGDNDVQTAIRVAVDQTTREVVVVGSFRGSITLGGETFVANVRDVYVVKYNADGAVVWARQIGRDSSQFVAGLAIDSQG